MYLLTWVGTSHLANTQSIWFCQLDFALIGCCRRQHQIMNRQRFSRRLPPLSFSSTLGSRYKQWTVEKLKHLRWFADRLSLASVPRKLVLEHDVDRSPQDGRSFKSGDSLRQFVWLSTVLTIIIAQPVEVRTGPVDTSRAGATLWLRGPDSGEPAAHLESSEQLAPLLVNNANHTQTVSFATNFLWTNKLVQS